MYRVAGMIGMAVIVSSCLFGYHASDLVGLWYSTLAGFGLVLLAAEALRGERSERGYQVAGSQRSGSLCPVVVRTDDYGRSRVQSCVVRSSTRDDFI